jgi:hypothetical protein
MEGFGDKGIVVDATHAFDDGRPHLLLEASTVSDTMISDHLIGAAVEAVVNKLFLGWSDAVISHGGAERACPRGKSHTEGAVEIEKDPTRGALV